MPSARVDLAIIGSGSGNSLITPFWDDKRVAIAESGVFGGTCLNVGCIPTKMFARPAAIAAESADAARLGVTLRAERVDWQGIRDRVFSRIDPISAAGRRYRDEELDNVLLVSQRVRLDGPRTLVAEDGTRIETEQLVIAAGSRPVLPEIPGIELPQVHTSDTVMRLGTLPERVVIIGGGTIACEFAGIFAGLGSTVVQLVRGDRLLRGMDDEVVDAFASEVERRWDVRYRTSAGRIDAIPAGAPREGVVVTMAGTKPDERIEADIVLVATGRRPNSDLVGAAEAGLDLEDDGRIAVDEYQRVLSGGAPVKGLYALGDVSSSLQLKHVANYEARVVAHNLEHPGSLRAATLAPVPFAVFSTPELAAVGLTEAEAVAEWGRDRVSSFTQRYADTAYGWAMEDETGVFKLVADRVSGRILGAHATGYQASNLVQPIVTAMSFGVNARAAARGQYWIHPALMEVVENALLGVEVLAGECER